MEHLFEKLFDLIFDLKKDQDIIKEQTIKNTTNLEVHMKRTAQNEELLKMADQRITKLENRDQIMSMLWKVSVSLAGFILSVLGIIVAIRELQ